MPLGVYFSHFLYKSLQNGSALGWFAGVNMAESSIDPNLFESMGYTRKKCVVSNLWFWTSNPDRKTCGDTNQDEYTFIGNPLISGFSSRGKELKNEMREAFISYFEQANHSRVEPYPVLARWRDDIHLNIASIANFQPHVTSGMVDPPANPLTISQPCIRLTDVDAVGRSGRHLTTFEMMAHHVFNDSEKGISHYWSNECIKYCHQMLTVTFGIDEDEITYVENPWSGGGNAGEAVEVIVGGLELATLVFMNLVEDENGDVKIKGESYSVMPLQIIDTGYGLERFCWAAAGTPTIYEAIYPETVDWLKQESGFGNIADQLESVTLDDLLGEMSKLNGIMNIEAGVDGDELIQIFINRLADRGITITAEQFQAVTEPLSCIYAIPDHLHALANMLGDGLVPSNAKSGYLARMLARRILRMRDDLAVEISLSDLMSHYLEHNFDVSNMTQSYDGILKILRLEEQRYDEMLRKGQEVIKTKLKKIDKASERIPDEILFELNDSHGLSPDISVTIARELGWSAVELRVGFSAELAERHAKIAKANAKVSDEKSLISQQINLPSTSLLYYEDVMRREFDASVLGCYEISHEVAGFAIILDRTCFYPEGGGQEGDYGELITQANAAKVIDTQKHGEYVLHLTDQPLEIGDIVRGAIDWSRRKQLMDHHTAVHVVGGAARRLLGPHVYQAGANKSVDSARLDITHYTRLTRDDLDEIEELSNQVIEQVSRTEKSELNRKDADKKYGFDLYQGGAPKGSEVRILRISDHDIQACGGTHHDDLRQIGSIRVVRSNAVQDGVERLHIVAGNAARNFSREQEKLLRKSAEVFGVATADLPRTAERFFAEWKDQKRKIENLEADIVKIKTSGGSGDEVTEIEGVRVVVMETHGTLKDMTKMLKELTLDLSKPTLAILGSKEGGGKLMVACTENSQASEKYNAVDILRSISPMIKGGGGGRPTFAQGGGSYPEGLEQALDEAKKLVGF